MNFFVRFGKPARGTSLVLRDVAMADAPRIVELAGVWDVARMSAVIPYPYSLDAARAWINSLEPDEIVRAIIVDGELVGVCGLVPVQNAQCECAELGYWVGEGYWGRGIATRAANAIIRFGFGEAGFKRLVSAHFTDNPASRRVLEKVGFRQVGANVRWCEARGRSVDAIEYELSRPAFWPWQRS